MLYRDGMNSPPIFCYHKITSRLDFGIGTRTPDAFRRDVAWIASLPASVRPQLTFDDGYDNTFTAAYPILAEHGLTASVFVVTSMLGKPNSWDSNFFGAFMHLSLSQLKALSSAGWHIGSHGVTHRALTTLSNTDLRRELLDSRQFLEDALGKAITQLSFPFGMFDARVIDECRSAGYTSALSIRCASSDGFVLRSKAVYRFDSPAQLRAKLADAPTELWRLRVINLFSGLTVAMHQFKRYA